MITLATLLLPLFLGLTLASEYAPKSAACLAARPFVQPANGLVPEEEEYKNARKAVADQNLREWLRKTHPALGAGHMPTVALSTSGGGYRSLLVGAGVVQGLDIRDSQISTSGLLQALTYQAGLSGGAWLLSSFAGNGFQTMSALKDKLWKPALQDTIFLPDSFSAPSVYVDIAADMLSKHDAGFPISLTDLWGRMLSYQLLEGDNGGISKTLSGIATSSNFSDHSAPFPIMVALGVEASSGECAPGFLEGKIWEFTPFSFGSWDAGVSAFFIHTAQLGTSLTNGEPTLSGCYTGFDNLGFVFGTSSAIFNFLCLPDIDRSLLGLVQGVLSSLPKLLSGLPKPLSTLVNEVANFQYALYPNPFRSFTSPTASTVQSSPVSDTDYLALVDGGQTNHNTPILPLLEPARNVSVLLLNDNAGDVNNFPNGTQLAAAAAVAKNSPRLAARMPSVPSVEVYLREKLHTRASFFGCYDGPEAVTIVYLPNTAFSFPSGTSLVQFAYTAEQTEGMIRNGVDVASQAGDEAWGVCLGCAIMLKEVERLPEECGACLERYCWRGE